MLGKPRSVGAPLMAGASFFWNIQNARSFLRPANDHARRYGARWADWREPRSALGHNVPGLLYWNITGAIGLANQPGQDQFPSILVRPQSGSAFWL